MTWIRVYRTSRSMNLQNKMYLRGVPERGPGRLNNYADQVRRMGCGLRKRIRVNLQTKKMNLQSEGSLEANRADSQSRMMDSESRAYLNVDQ